MALDRLSKMTCNLRDLRTSDLQRDRERGTSVANLPVRFG